MIELGLIVALALAHRTIVRLRRELRNVDRLLEMREESDNVIYPQVWR